MALDVELKLTDEDYRPLSGVPLRLVFGTGDWQALDAGIRIVTAPASCGTSRRRRMRAPSGGKRWHRKLGIVRLCKPVLP